jgi:uncharacterized membrane protein YfcA
VKDSTGLGFRHAPRNGHPHGSRDLASLNGDALLLAAAGFGAGLVNGVAGGGTLLSFPALLAVGHPAVVANVTSSVGIWTGYLGGVAGFRREVAAQRDRVRALAPVALGGGLTGAVLLLVTPADLFEDVAPVLVLLACALFAAQPVLAGRLRARRAERGAASSRPAARRAGIPLPALVGTFAASIYGGYFGPGLGVILLAVLGLALDDELVRVNGVRGVLSLAVSSVTVVVFAIGADVDWADAGVLAVTALIGGYSGARLSRRLPVPVLRAVVIVLGVVAAAKLWAG